MGRKGHWRIVGYDGAGQAIRARSGPRVERERPERTDRPHRDALRDMMSRDERRNEDRAIRDLTGVPVR